MTLKRKTFYTIIVFALFSLGYFLIQHLVPVDGATLLVELDKAIPLMPEFIWIYHSLPLYILIVMVFLIKRAPIFWRTFSSCIMSSAVMFLCFAFVPVEYPRPEILVSGASSSLLAVTQAVDLAHNTCPSGHVAFAWLMFLAAIKTQWVRDEPWLGRVYLLWAVGIALSTLVLKQHFVADVIAGIFLATFSFYVAKFTVKAIPASN